MKYINIKVSGKVSGKLTPEENFSLFRVGVWVNVMVSFRVGGNQTVGPKKNVPWLGLEFVLGLVLGLGDNFPRGQFS